MILSFSKPKFKNKILNGIKIHTIRKDYGNRWEKGKKIHFWMHNPRNVTKNPYCFAEGIVSKIEIFSMLQDENLQPALYIDGLSLSNDKYEEFAINDGFESLKDFYDYFKYPMHAWKIIHWKDLKIIGK